MLNARISMWVYASFLFHFSPLKSGVNWVCGYSTAKLFSKTIAPFYISISVGGFECLQLLATVGYRLLIVAIRVGMN